MKYSGIGGQAVIEGVMMKGKSRYAVSVRKPDGQIEVKVEDYKSLKEKYAIAKLGKFLGRGRRKGKRKFKRKFKRKSENQ